MSLPVAAVEDVEEAVLVRLHDDLARLPVDGEIGEHQLLHGVEVPLLAGCGLVVPHVCAGVGVERDDRGQEQVVALARGAVVARPFDAVADAEVDEIQIRVVGDRVPRRAAAAELPPLAAPGLRGHLHGLVLERLRGSPGTV